MQKNKVPQTNENIYATDVLVIGSGIAGGITALTLADAGYNVAVITKAKDPKESNTFYAQGGIIGEGEDDSWQELMADIVKAGDGITNDRAAEILAKEGPELVNKLLAEKLGVVFEKATDGNKSNKVELALTKEGGHSRKRIVHNADATGKAIAAAIERALKNNPQIKLHTHYTAVDLLTPAHHSKDKRAIYEPLSCVGAYVLDNVTGKVHKFISKYTVLATGGLGRIFEFTTNPAIARGDGIAMAHRAGARVANLEFVQFHPTAFYHIQAPRFLITEAVRGEGGRLTDSNGKPFMQNYEPDKDLATRDKVSRAIYSELMKSGEKCVYLDLKTYIAKDKILSRFPTIYAKLLGFGVDITKDLVPVVPAAHYSCGGVWTDVETGETTINNLYAVGEVACNGLHGANRLASTSLLEGVVWGIRTAKDINNKIKNKSGFASGFVSQIKDWQPTNTSLPDQTLITQDLKNIQSIMWNYVGLSRNRERLARARIELGHIERSIENFYQHSKVNDDLLGLRNSARTAVLVTESAWENKTSAGCHFVE